MGKIGRRGGGDVGRSYKENRPAEKGLLRRDSEQRHRLLFEFFL